MNKQEKFIAEIRQFKEFINKNIEKVEPKSTKCNAYDILLGNWFIPKQSTDQFLSSYDACIQKSAEMHTYERSDDVRGIMIDLDIDQTSGQEIYSDEFFLELSDEISAFIYGIIGPGATYTDRIFVTRRQEITKADKYDSNGNMLYRDGIHIIYPSIRISKAFRKYIFKKLREGIMGMIDNVIDTYVQMVDRELYRASSDFTTWVDEHAVVVPCLLPGSQKIDTTKKPHKIIFSGIVAYNPKKTCAKRSDKVWADISGPMVLVLEHSSYPNNYYQVPDDLDIGSQELAILAAQQEEEDDESVDIDTISIQNPEAAYITKLLGILPSKYYDDYEHWFKVLCALSSIGHRFKCIAQWFSKKSKKYNKEYFEGVWSELTMGQKTKKITKRSIMYWAKKENPVKFAEIDAFCYMKLLIDFIVETSGSFGHGKHAKLLFNILSHKYVFSSQVDHKNAKLSKKCWYSFVMPDDNHRYGEIFKWRAEPEAVSLKRYIMENYTAALSNEGMKYINDKIDNINPAENAEASKHWANIKKNFKTTITKLNDISYIEKVTRAAELYFERREFIDELDKAPQIIGVANGILKVGAQCKFIAKHHEYPIMLHTAASYVPYEETSGAVQRIRKIFSQVYRDPDVCDFIWFMASTGLDRRQVTGKMLFILGSGANGKTATMNFIQNALGLNLCASIKMALLTGQSGKASEADSAFMQAKGKTLVIFDEGSGSDVLNSEKVKNIINNNAQSGRDLYGIQENFWLHCCAFNTSNHDPIIRSSDTDHGFWRRVYFTRAKSKFTENPDPNKTHEYNIDPEIESKLTSDPLHLNAVLSIMTYYYEKLITTYGGNLNNVPCNTIKEETNKFRQEQDKSFRYCYEKIIISPIGVIGASELGEHYSKWATLQFRDSINASKAENYLSTGVLGTFKSGFDYVGIRMKEHGPVNKAKNELSFAEYVAMDDKEKSIYNEKATNIRIEFEKQRTKDNEEFEDQDEY